MAELFPADILSTKVPAIPGLFYRPEYLTKQQEVDLTQAIDAQVWDTSWERRRQPYGKRYGEPAPGEVHPIPDWGRDLVERLFREGVSDRPFDQMLINEYLPGQGIALHRDYSPFDRTVASISLLSAYIMDFRELKTGRRESLLMERRSLLILSDAARYEWQHGIARRKNDRWQGRRIPRGRRLSITFRLGRAELSEHF
jgi:alkylated DNA repair dioxygenase AlkB